MSGPIFLKCSSIYKKTKAFWKPSEKWLPRKTYLIFTREVNVDFEKTNLHCTSSFRCSFKQRKDETFCCILVELSWKYGGIRPKIYILRKMQKDFSFLLKGIFFDRDHQNRTEIFSKIGCGSAKKLVFLEERHTGISASI